MGLYQFGVVLLFAMHAAVTSKYFPDQINGGAIEEKENDVFAYNANKIEK